MGHQDGRVLGSVAVLQLGRTPGCRAEFRRADDALPLTNLFHWRSQVVGD